MKKFDYKTVELPAYHIEEVDEKHLQEVLEKHGSYGYELTSVITFDNSAGFTMQRLYFKKE